MVTGVFPEPAREVFAAAYPQFPTRLTHTIAGHRLLTSIPNNILFQARGEKTLTLLPPPIRRSSPKNSSKLTSPAPRRAAALSGG